MTKHRQVNNLLAAGSLVGLLVLTFFAFDSDALSNVFAAQPSNEISGIGATTDSTIAETQILVDQQTWQMLNDQNNRLHETIGLLEGREQEYRAAVETANQTIQQLQESSLQINAAPDSKSQELTQTIQTFQSREGEFRQQIEQANATVQQLQTALQQARGTTQSLQQQNGELARLVQVMQQREAQYQTELERANAALQTQASSATTYTSYEGEHEEYEHEEHEHEYEDDDD